MSELMLSCEDLSVGYEKKVVIEGVTLSIKPGEILTLIGANGSGKSTLLKTFSKQLESIAGVVYLAGKNLKAINEKELSKLMSLVITEKIDANLMTVYDIVATGRYPYTGRFGILQNEDKLQINNALVVAEVSELADRMFYSLSDGQKQRVMLARAICQQPNVMILDEPTTFLDIKYKLNLLDTLKRLAKEKNISIVLSLHELELAKNISDILVCVKDGKIDKVGTANEIFAGDYIKKLYEVDSELYKTIYHYLEEEQKFSEFNHYIRCGQKKLRLGFTTGTCAALATQGAITLLLTGVELKTVSLLTPKGIEVSVTPEFYRVNDDGSVSCGVKKDAGDDSDVTDSLTIVATVYKTERGIMVDGGSGVGRVTKAGLDQNIGEAAINKTPRAMIKLEAEKIIEEQEYDGGIKIIISIPGGEEVAAKTFNGELGIVGGLSVLGTSGIVEPMSEKALIDTIELSLKQAHSEKGGAVILTPGNYGENFLTENLKEVEVPIVKYSNFLGEALDIAVNEKFSECLLVGHVGKLIKIAGGIMNTHSKVADCRKEIFCSHAIKNGASVELAKKILETTTTDACIELLISENILESTITSVLNQIERCVLRRVNNLIKVGVVMFSNIHGTLGITENAKTIIETWKQREGEQ